MESTEKNYSRDGMREGDPGSINSNDFNRKTPDKNVSETDPLRAEESDHGRYVSQKPDTENLDQHISQIDEGTKKMLDDESAKAAEKGV